VRGHLPSAGGILHHRGNARQIRCAEAGMGEIRRSIEDRDAYIGAARRLRLEPPDTGQHARRIRHRQVHKPLSTGTPT
jgi:hypothetical protein